MRTIINFAIAIALGAHLIRWGRQQRAVVAHATPTERRQVRIVNAGLVGVTIGILLVPPRVHMDDDGPVWASVAPHMVSPLGGCDHCRRVLGFVLVQLDGETPVTAPPNKRLKLTGSDRFKGSGVFVPWRAPTVVQPPCAGGRVARSLSAIR